MLCKIIIIFNLNWLFLEGRYNEASQKYTDALGFEKNAVLLCKCKMIINILFINLHIHFHYIYIANRAFCHLKLELYGLAVADATEAIELDKEYIKVSYFSIIIKIFS